MEIFHRKRYSLRLNVSFWGWWVCWVWESFLEETTHQIHHAPVSKLIETNWHTHWDSSRDVTMRTSRESRGMWRLSKSPLGWSHHVPPVLWRTSVRTGRFWISKSTFSWIKTEESLTGKSCTNMRWIWIRVYFKLPQDDSMRTSKHVPTIPMEESTIQASKRNQILHISTNHHHLNLYISKKNLKKSSFLR